MAEGRKLEGLARDDQFLDHILSGLLSLNVEERRGGQEVDHFRAVMGLAVNNALQQKGVLKTRPYAGVVRDFLSAVRFQEEEVARLMVLLSQLPTSQQGVLRRLLTSLSVSPVQQASIYNEQLKNLLQLRLLAGGLDMREQFLLQARETNIDPLTQLLNRRGLDHYIRSILAEDPNAFGAVLLLDIDHFKRVNDEHGHDNGDSALQLVARIFEDAVRLGSDEIFRLQSNGNGPHPQTSDEDSPPQVVRMGGEEILGVLPGVGNLRDAEFISERVRQGIERAAPGVLGFPLTATIGVALGPLRHIKELTSLADQLLYKGKNDGRNQVVSGAIDAESVPANNYAFKDPKANEGSDV